MTAKTKSQRKRTKKRKTTTKFPLLPSARFLLCRVAKRVSRSLLNHHRRTICFSHYYLSDLPLQFRFDLSLRHQSTIYITYKGSAPRSPEPMSFVKHIAPIVVDGKVENRLILRDATLARPVDKSFDSKSSFSSNMIGGGIFDVRNYGVRPLADQGLSKLKDYIRSFVIGSTTSSMGLDEENAKSQCGNVVVRRTGLKSYQYLFVANEPMEAGQTVPLYFPSASSILKSEQYKSSISPERQAIVDAFHVLSKHDLQQMVIFLASDIVDSIQLQTIMQGGAQEQQSRLGHACCASLRLSWLASHLLYLWGSKSPTSAWERCRLLFDMDVPSDSLDAEALEAAHKESSKEFQLGLKCLLELDSFCGGTQKHNWCRLMVDYFDDLIDALSECKLNDSASMKDVCVGCYEKISFIEEDVNETNKWVFQKSPLLVDSDEVGENVAIVKSKGKFPLKSSSDFENEVIAVDWYRSSLFQILCKVIHGCNFLMKSFPIAAIISEIKAENMVFLEYALPAMECFPHPSPSIPRDMYQPQSLQFFLGIVWPVLREFGWRVEVVEYPSVTRYIAPKWQDHLKQGKLAKLAKQQRDRNRYEISRKVNQMGLGNLPKLTKRLFAASRPDGKDGSIFLKSESTTSISEISSMFLESRFDGKSSLDKAKQVVDLILQCFDEQAPSICREASDVVLNENELARDTCNVGIFMHFLLILPSLLMQSELPLQEINDSLQVIQDLAGFCSEASSVFPKSMIPSTEIYSTPEKISSQHMVGRLENDASSGEELTEVIWEEDKKVLSDFVVSVMEQVLACRASEEDTRKKARKIHLGYPGAVCRHCRGMNGDGRYFFTTIESLTTLGTVFEKHVSKCPDVPEDIKQAIVANKLMHHEQRKLLPSGSQQAFFLRLWDRLRTMRISSENTSVAVPLTQQPEGETEKKEEEKQTPQKKEFSNPTEVMDFIRTTSPWKGTREIDMAVSQYYTCVDFGGRIYNTRGMPTHFSPGWLLAKVGPKRKKFKTNNLPG